MIQRLNYHNSFHEDSCLEIKSGLSRTLSNHLSTVSLVEMDDYIVLGFTSPNYAIHIASINLCLKGLTLEDYNLKPVSKSLLLLFLLLLLKN